MPHRRDAHSTLVSRVVSRRQVLAAVLATGSLSLASPAAGAAGAAGPAQRLEDAGYTRIIVKREPDLSRAERTDVRRDADVSFVRSLAIGDAEVVRAPRGDLVEAVRELRRDPDVEWAEPDAPVRMTGNDALWGDLWGLENLGQTINGRIGSADADVDGPEAWQTSTGAGVSVAVIDSGVDFGHPDLAGQSASNPGESGDGRESNGIDDDGNGFVDDFRGWDWVQRDNAPDDVNGHGTHVAGIVAARRGNGEGIAGIAPDAKVLSLRVLDDRGAGYSSAAAEAITYAGRLGYRVVNASLGGTVYVKALEDAIAAHPETLYVFAAGNGARDAVTGQVAGVDIDGTPFYPCALPQANVVCVGATDSTDAPGSFSNYGSRSVDLHAPGVGIRSAYKGTYAFMSGTSMASPFVAGAAALVASARPGATAALLSERLLTTSEPLASLAGRSATGARLNAAAAVALPAATAEPGPQIGDSPAPEPVPAAAEPAPTVPVVESTTATVSSLRLSTTTLTSSMRASFALDRAVRVRLIVRQRVCSSSGCRNVTRRTSEQEGHAGTNSATIARTRSGQRLAAGTYTLTVAPAAGGSDRSVGFRVR